MAHLHQTLYVSNISDVTNEDDFISHFKQFGDIIKYILYPKTCNRTTAAALLTYDSSVDVSSIVERHRRMIFDNRTLLLRRMLPTRRPAYEYFMASHEVVLSMEQSNEDAQFNEINIQNYFSKYGKITSCHTVIPYRKYLITFVKATSVDCAILGEPHFYNEIKLTLRKYIAPIDIESIHTRNLLHNRTKNTKLFYANKIRRLKCVIEALEYGQKLQLEMIKFNLQKENGGDKQNHVDNTLQLINTLKQKCNNLNKKIKQIKAENLFLTSMIEQVQIVKTEFVDSHEKKIQHEQNRADQLKAAIILIDTFLHKV